MKIVDIRVAIFVATSLLSTTTMAAGGTGGCSYQQAVAKSERIALFSPRVFANVGGYNQVGDVPFADTYGLSSSLSNWYVASVQKDMADANCQRLAAESAVDGLRVIGTDVGLLKAYESQVPHLDRAIQMATDLSGQAQAALQAGEITLADKMEVDQRLLELRLESLRVLGEIQRLQALPPVPDKPSLPELRGALTQADAQLEASNSDLRRSQNWNVEVEAGYARLSGTNHAYVALKASIALADFMQAHEEQDVQRLRPAALSEQIDSFVHLLDTLDAALQTQLTALKQSEDLYRKQASLLADEQKNLRQVDTRKARLLADGLEVERLNTVGQIQFSITRRAYLKKLLGLTP